MATETIATSKPTTLSNPPSITSTILALQPPSNPPTFSFTPFLRTTYSHALTTTVPICPAFLAGHCPLGRRCPDRHPTGSGASKPSHTSSSSYNHHSRANDNYVCKHWLKALCMKGAGCEYLHEYNLRKMSECQFFNLNGYCQNGDECLYLHVKEESRLPLCRDYEAGFCAKGAGCKERHVRRRLCGFFLVGFCPQGRECRLGVHLKPSVEGKKEEGKGKSGKREREDKEDEERREKEREREREREREFGRRDRSEREEGGRWRGRGGGGGGGGGGGRGGGGGGGKWKNRRER